MRARVLGAAAALFFLGASASAQFVLKPVGEAGEKLRPKSLSAMAQVRRGFAEVAMTWVFANPLDRRTEADFLYVLPEGALATSFAYWKGDEKVLARVSEKERAREIYRVITTPRRDPALVELQGRRTLKARIFPVIPGEDLKVEITWVTPLGKTKTGEELRIPLKMEGKPLDKIDVHVWLAPDAGQRRVFNSYGAPLQLGKDGKLVAWSGEGVRPEKDLVLGIATDQAARCYSARSSGSTGYFAAFLRGSGRVRAEGGGITSLRQESVLGGVLATGRYTRPGEAVLILQGRRHPVVLDDRSEPGNLALKLWAGQEIARLDQSPGGKGQAVSLSIAQGLLSRHTAWIAIPQQEREEFDWTIKRAAAAVMARNMALAKIDGRTGLAARYERQLKDECSRLHEDWNWLYESALSQAADASVAQAVEDAKAGRWRQAGRTLARLRAAGAARWGVDPYQSFFEEAPMPDGARIGNLEAAILNDWQNGRPLSARSRQAIAVLNRAGARLGVDWKFLVSPFVNAAYLGSIYNGENTAFGSPEEAESQTARLKAMAARAKEMGFRLRSASASASAMRQFGAAGPDLALAKEALGTITAGEKRQLAAWRSFRARAGGILPENKRLLWGLASTAFGVRLGIDAGHGSIKPSPLEPYQELARIVSKAPAGERPALAAQATASVRYEAAKASGQLILNGGGIDRMSRQYDDFVKSLPGLTGLAGEGMAKAYLRLAQDGFTPLAHAQQIVKSDYWRLYSIEWAPDASPALIRAKRAETEEKWKTVRLSEADFIRATSEPRISYLRALRQGGVSPEALERLRRGALEPTLGTRGAKYNELRDQVLRRSVEMAQERDKGSAGSSEKIDRLSTEIKELRVRMGDPLLSVALPKGVLTAAVVFPWGESAPLAWNARTGQWERRFDVPPSAQPGLNHAVILAFGSDGLSASSSFGFVVDLEAPQIEAVQTEGRLVVKDLGGDVARVKVLAKDGDPVELEPASGGRWTAPVASGQPLRVIATDRAHNRTELGRGAPVRTPLPVVEAPLQARLMEGQNIQALCVWKNRLAAATLDEGLWVATNGSAVQVEGLPSTAPRTLAVLGDDLVVRFGTGDLILLHPDLTWTSLNGSLPRKQAMAVSVFGGSLAVAQPGMLSILSNGVWTHRIEAAWKGAPVSSLLLTKDRVWVGLQGRGVLSQSLLDSSSSLIDERQGLNDDWVTVMALDPLRGAVLGSFAGGAVCSGFGGFRMVSGTEGSCTTSLASCQGAVYVGTRSGLIAERWDRIERISSPAGDEIQALAVEGSSLWVGTRSGLFRLAPPSPKGRGSLPVATEAGWAAARETRTPPGAGPR